MRIENEFTIEEYKGGEFSSTMTLIDDMFEDGCEYITSKMFKTKLECRVQTRNFIAIFNAKMEVIE